MKKLLFVIGILFPLLAGFITAAAFAVPGYINYQGVLRNSAGDLQTGTFNMQFKIYSALTGGSALYDSDTGAVSVSNGVYSVELGEIPNPETVFDGTSKYLEIVVDSETLSPRLKINTVAYAIRADVAGTTATATHATSADSATSAEAVDDFSASSTATANTLLALDSEKKFTISGSSSSPIISGTNTSSGPGVKGSTSTGIGVSAEATGAGGVALAVSGKIKVGICVGEATILGTNPGVVVNNSNVTSSSIILLTITDADAADRALKVESITNGVSFEVKTVDETSIGLNDITFRYIIIN